MKQNFVKKKMIFCHFLCSFQTIMSHNPSESQTQTTQNTKNVEDVVVSPNNVAENKCVRFSPVYDHEEFEKDMSKFVEEHKALDWIPMNRLERMLILSGYPKCNKKLPEKPYILTASALHSISQFVEYAVFNDPNRFQSTCQRLYQSFDNLLENQQCWNVAQCRYVLKKLERFVFMNAQKKEDPLFGSCQNQKYFLLDVFDVLNSHEHFVMENVLELFQKSDCDKHERDEEKCKFHELLEAWKEVFLVFYKNQKKEKFLNIYLKT